MPDPFAIRVDEINDRTLKEGPARSWIESVAPSKTEEIEYLRSSLKLRRFRASTILAFAVVALFVGRSAQLQIAHREEYRIAAESNRLRIVSRPAPRGTITDRHGAALTRNVPRFQLLLNPLHLPKDAEEKHRVLAEIAELGNIPLDTLIDQSAAVRLPVHPLVIKDRLTLEETYPLLIATQNFPGIYLESFSDRQYVASEVFAHLVGYLGKISEDEKKFYLTRGYALNDRIGKTGLEAAFEQYLKGKDGRQYIEVDAQGYLKQTVASQEAVTGGTLRITIDAPLQRRAASLLQDGLKRAGSTRGALVALSPQTGEILALISLPSFDNNLFTQDPTQSEALTALFSNPDRPLFARAIAGTYPSGSTIKLAIAASALDAGVITSSTTLLSSGGLQIGQWFFPDWRASGHGLTDVTKAIADSVNTFFYIVGGGYDNFTGLGVERLAQYLTRFGFGAPSGIELSGEAPGLIPTPYWKETVRGEKWYIGDTYHLAIGQGDILVTPLQIARMTAYFANGGKWIQPHLVADPSLRGSMPPLSNGPHIDPQHLQTVRQGMRDAVRYGSARSLQTLPLESAGKTGTAQWSSTKKPHAWFTGFAPYRNPEIVITVLIEEGGEGSVAALPVTKELLREWSSMRDLKDAFDSSERD